MPTIPASALPIVTPGTSDSIVGVDESNGNARRFPIANIPVHFLQSGTGAVSRTVQEKASETVTPEDFGAAGTGMIDDTIAIQLAVDSGAKRVVGKQGSRYLVNPQRVQWTEEDLHRLGVVPAGIASFADGYWCAITVPTEVDLEGLHIIVPPGASASKAAHVLGFGDPTSVTRHKRNKVRRCRFELGEGSGIRPRMFVAQSVDRFEFSGNDLIGIDETDNLVGGYLFDCTRFKLNDNDMQYVELGFVTQFCSNGTVNGNTAFDCKTILDVDKLCDNMTVCNNTFDRATLGGAGGSVDAIFEFNGCTGVVCTGNRINNAGRGIQYGAKAGVADSWAAALAGTAVATFRATSDVVSQNVITNTRYHGILVGSDWTGSPHNGVAGTENVTLLDTVTNAWIYGTDAAYEQAAIIVNECDGLRVDVQINGSGARGLALRSIKESTSTGAGVWSILRAEKIAGSIRDCADDGFSALACNELNFDGLYITDCGSTINVMASLRECDEKTCKIYGRLTIDRGDSTANNGLLIGAGGASTWNAALFSAVFDSLVIKGAFSASSGLNLDAEDTSTISAVPIVIRSGTIDQPDAAYFTRDGAPSIAGTPVAAFTPRYIGEMAFDRTNSRWYRSFGTAANTDWGLATDTTVLTGSAVYDPASLADGTGVTTTVTVTGATFGSFAEASFADDLQGITLTAWVSAADTVSVRFQNETGGAINLGNKTLRARVRKPS